MRAKLLFIFFLGLYFYNKVYPQNYFIENRGQWQPGVRFVGQSSGYNVIITDQDILIDIPDYSIVMNDSSHNPIDIGNRHSGCVYKLQILSDSGQLNMIDDKTEIRGFQKLPTYFNYFIGNDSTKWFTWVTSFKTIEFKDQGQNPGFSIAFSSKDLIISYDKDDQPVTKIQLVSENIIPVSFKISLNSRNYTLNLSDFANNRSNIKKEVNEKVQWDEHDDRNLVYSSYLGGSNMEIPGLMYVDKEGYCYLTGYAERDFPTTPGSYKEIDTVGILSGYISKISPDGKTLLYSTYLSGMDQTYLLSIKCDKNKNIYVGGYANSQNDYPTTSNALLQSGDRKLDFIISKLDPSGTKILYSTFLGGTDYEDEVINFIEVDKEENIYLVGCTRSKDYPVTEHCLKVKMSGKRDIVITKINTITGNLVYSTFFGCQSEAENVTDIDLDSEGCLYLCGYGVLNDFPVTKGVIKDSIRPDESSAFISKLGKNGDSLVFSSFFGGTSTTYTSGGIACIDVAENGNIFIGGMTISEDFPVTSEDIGLRPLKNASLWGTSYITELDPKCSYIINSTCINNKKINQNSSFNIGKISHDGICTWICGDIHNNYFSPTDDAFQDEGEMCFMKVSADFRKILYLSYIEDNHIEYHDFRDKIRDMSIINGSQLYLSGQTINPIFPVSANSFQPWSGGYIDAFVMKFDMTTVGVGDDVQLTDSDLFSISPNPATDFIDINLERWTPSARWSPSEIKIYNALGECVLSVGAELALPTHRLDISALPPGVYYCTVRTGSFIETQPFVVIH